MYLHFSHEFFGYVGKSLDYETKVDFQSYGLTNWNTKNYNKHIAGYLKNKREADDESWTTKKHNKHIPRSLKSKKQAANQIW